MITARTSMLDKYVHSRNISTSMSSESIHELTTIQEAVLALNLLYDGVFLSESFPEQLLWYNY